MIDNNPHSPFFSIVLPVYGVEAYVADALNDIQRQTFSDWEVIVVDDASPDASAAIAQGFADADARIRVVHHEVNQGLSGARNTGMAEAVGSYLWIPDPDDRYEPTLLEQVHASLQDNLAPVVMIGHSEEFFDVDGRFLRSVDFPLDEAAYTSAGDFRPQVIAYEQGTHYGYVWNKIYRRPYLQSLDVRFETVPLIEDIKFNVAVFQSLPALNTIAGPLYRYAKRDGANLTNKFVSRYYELHHERIRLLYEQQKSWGLLNDTVKETLGALLARYVLSALERNCEAESNMGRADRRRWCRDCFEDPLFCELIPYARSTSVALKACLVLLKAKNIGASLVLGRLIHCAKHSGGQTFVKVKSSR